MAKLTINTGRNPNDKTGDSLKLAFTKVNNNFTELYSAIGADVQIPIQTGNAGKVLTTNGSTLSWGNTNKLVNGSYNFTLGVDGTINFDPAANGKGVLQTTADLWFNANGAIYNFGTDGNLTLPDSSKVVGALTSSFTGTIVGTTLTVTGATPGTIAWEQAVEGIGLDPDTFIDYQLTGTSGGNGTYKITPSQNIGPISMNVSAMYLNSSIKLAANHCLYQQDEHDATLYNFLIGIQNAEATVHIGDINTNGVCITNDKEYKVHSALNVGTYMAVAKVDSTDNVILSSGNASTTKIRVGGDSAVGGYALKFNNGGQALMPVGLRIGDNVNSSIFGAPLEVGSVLAGNANNQSNPGGIALPTYRGTATTIANDEWGSYIYGSRYRGTANAPLAVKQDDWLMEFGATAFDGNGGNNGGGEMAFRVDGAVTSTANPSRWELYVTPTGTNSQTLGLKVDSSLTVTTYGRLKLGGAVPAHSYGAAGDAAGMVAFDGNYIYYCKTAYVNNSTNIWVRVAWTGTNW